VSAIFGHWRLDGSPVDSFVADEMSRRLEYRGRAAASAWSAGPVSLGHRALRATSHGTDPGQLVLSPDGDIVAIADARLDNRRELTSALGPPVREGITDTELIFASYRVWGERCVEHWLGDFAVAIWDGPRRRMFCARDPFGVKPLYYHHAPGRLFAFASDVEALFALREISNEVNDFEVARHLLLPLGRDASTTYYRNVRRLIPAHTMMVSEDKVEARRYWSLDPSRELRLSGDREYAEALRETFTEAVRCRLRGTTPIASMLSGGIDSSSIACVAANLLEGSQNAELHALSAIYPDAPESDERAYIRSVLDRYRMVPHSFAADAANPVADIDRMNRLIGGANWGPNLYLNWVLYGIAADAGAGVVLDGFDGDSSLSSGVGYLPELARTGRWLKLTLNSIAYSHRLERPIVSDLRHLIRLGLRHPVRETILISLARRTGRWKEKGPKPDASRADRFPLLNPEFVRRFSDQVVSEESPPTTEREFHIKKLSGLALLEGIGWLEACAAGRGVEVRLPFCDVRLVELCVSFPAEQKLRRGWGRYAMRNAMEGILPAAIQWRTGKTSLHRGWERAWKSSQNGRIESLLADPSPTIAQYLDPERVLELHRQFLDGTAPRNDERALWRAISLALWLSPQDG
jgi:asparagine synthase (glutamine-hydrolysing)